MIRLPRDFADFLRLLHSNHVEDLLIGGCAVGYHGYCRNTNDLDLWVALHPENARKPVRGIREFGFDVPELNEQLFLRKGRIVRMGIEANRIKTLTGISACEFSGWYARKVPARVDGIPVSLISLADLRANKRASGRNKDLADLDYLPPTPLLP